MSEKKVQPESQQKELRSRIAKAPRSPGVYKWLSNDGIVLYVGKAKNLKKRLLTYVPEKPDTAKLGPWKTALLKHITDFDVTVTSTELEALILETNLIKEIRPKFNVLMKDDKNYVYVKITSQDAYPTVETVRIFEDDSALYFGPYLTAYRINHVLEILDIVLKFRACKQSIAAGNRAADTPAPPKTTECLEYQIGKCNGLCIGEINHAEYNKRTDGVVRFLRGDHAEVIEQLKNEIAATAAAQQFEKAAKLRDTLLFVESLKQKQVVSDTSRANTDAVGVALHGGKAQVVVLRERNGKLIEKQQIALSGNPESAEEVLAQFLPQYYSAATDIPDVVLISHNLSERNVLEAWLSQLREKRVTVTVPERGKKSKLLTMAEHNAEEQVQQQLAKWEAAAKNVADALTELKTVLDLSVEPKRIECYDISHLGGSETVGAMSVVRNGKASSDHYRSFAIRTLQEGAIDDYAALQEVLKRRLLYLVRNLKEEEKQWKKKGITFGKARKGEQKVLEEIVGNEDALSNEGLDYKTFSVMRSGKDVTACMRLVTNEGKIVELKSLWVKDTYRGARLGQFLVRKLLSKTKKGKVYTILDPIPKLEEYYAEVGFRHVLTPPEVLQKKTEEFHKEHPNHPIGTIMVFDSAKNKTDPSLTSRPNLLMIDGGKGQLSCALKVLHELNLQIPCIGLAKREEEVFVPGEKSPVAFQKDSQALFLLMRLRDEAHRFANRHRKKRAAHTATHSALDDVPGIGEQTRTKLLKEYGSVEAIAKASDSDLAGILTKSQLQALRRSL